MPPFELEIVNTSACGISAVLSSDYACPNHQRWDRPDLYSASAAARHTSNVRPHTTSRGDKDMKSSILFALVLAAIAPQASFGAEDRPTGVEGENGYPSQIALASWLKPRKIRHPSLVDHEKY
jgi:hypothetical protein